MIRRIATPILVVVLAACFSLAQRSRNPMEPMRPDGDDTSDKQLIVYITYPGEKPAGEHIDVLLQSAQGGTVAEIFTNNEGKATFQGVRPGTYVIRIRGIDIKETVTDVFTIDSFERSHHEYVRAVPLGAEGANESKLGALSVTELQAVPENARKEFEKGNEALAHGDHVNAIEHLRKAASLYPKFVRAYNNLAAAYMKTRDFSHAHEALDEALQADSENPLTKANLIRLALLEHKYTEAIPMVQSALAKDPNNGEFLFLMCEAQFFSGKYGRALIFARKAYNTPQHSEMAHIFAGRSLEAMYRHDEARAEYSGLLQESPGAPEAAEASRSLTRLENVKPGQQTVF